MLITQGEVKVLSGRPWAGIELASENELAETVIRLIRWLKEFVTGPAEMFVPIERGKEEMIAPYIFIRVAESESLAGSTVCRGVTGLVRSGGKPLEFDNGFVSEVMDRCWEARQAESKGIEVGSVVRVMVGQEHGLVGTVESLRGDRAQVGVEMKTRSVVLHIPVRALKNLGKKRRPYWWSK